MRDYARAHTKLSDNLDTAKENELVFVDNDLIIKKQQNNVSLYAEFLSSCIDKGLIKNKPTIYGFTIDFTESDPIGSVTYIEENSSFTPIAREKSGICKYNSWDERTIRQVFGIRPCLMKDGKVTAYLKPDDYSLDIQGLEVYAKDSDAMIQFGHMYYKYISTSNSLTFKVANYKPDDTYTDDIFNNESDMYVSIYNIFGDDNISSITNNNINNSTGLDIKNVKSKLKSGYSLLSYKRYIYILSLACLFTKSFDPLYIIGKGTSDSVTGLLDKKGLFYFGSAGTKIFGLENFWEYYTYLDGVSNAKNSIYSVNEEGIKSLIDRNIFEQGWISKIKYKDGYLYPCEYAGSSTTYAGSFIVNKDEDNLLDFSNIYFGGIKDDPVRMGSFSLRLKEPDYITCRLCYN